jgi:predicted lactoylglutathione lyase
MLFVNMPVAELERSKAFLAQRGFSYNRGAGNDARVLG